MYTVGAYTSLTSEIIVEFVVHDQFMILLCCLLAILIFIFVSLFYSLSTVLMKKIITNIFDNKRDGHKGSQCRQFVADDVNAACSG